jgi:DNA-binding NarL/FixJ family response regulator
MGRLRIVIADDHEIVRRGIRSLLEARKDWEVCGEAGDSVQAVELVRKLKPDILLLDIAMPGDHGIEVARTVRDRYPGTEVLIHTMQESPMIASEALAAGARGLVYKSDAGQDLLTAIDMIVEKKPFLSPRVTQMILQSGMPSPAEGAPELSSLTPRELEVLKLLAEGESAKETASDLGISHKTVNIHRANIMAKLKLHSLSALIHFAIRNKVVEL